MAKEFLEPPPNLTDEQWEQLLAVPWQEGTKYRFREIIQTFRNGKNAPIRAGELFDDPILQSSGTERFNTVLNRHKIPIRFTRIGPHLPHVERSERLLAFVIRDDLRMS